MQQIATEIQFDVFKTLYIIENDKMLDGLLKRYVPNVSYSLLRTMFKDNTLESKTLEIIESIFNDVIKEDEKIIDKYESLGLDTIITKARPSKFYGKEKTLQDIAANGKTELDLALLAINDMKNNIAKLRRRCINAKRGQTTLCDEDYRGIVAATQTFTKKITPVIKKK